MIIWTYRISGKTGTIITQDSRYAELKSKMGYLVYCTRKNTMAKFFHY